MSRKTIAEVAKEKGMTLSEMSAKGGRATKGVPKRFKMTPRRNCVAKCPMYGSCPVKYLSDKKYEGKCALARMPKKAQHLVEQSVLGGEGTFEEVLKELVTMLVLATEGSGELSLSERRKTVRLAMDYYKTVYGAKSRQEVKMEGDDVFGLGRMAEIIREAEAEKRGGEKEGD